MNNLNKPMGNMPPMNHMVKPPGFFPPQNQINSGAMTPIGGMNQPPGMMPVPNLMNKNLPGITNIGFMNANNMSMPPNPNNDPGIQGPMVPPPPNQN